jgi:DNA-3-methyladenine glycosylase II
VAGVTLTPSGAFSLEQSIDFVAGFAPAASPQPDSERLLLGLTDDSGVPCAISVRQRDATLEVDYVSELPVDAVRAHAARLLSVDVDGAGFAEVGGRDPVVAGLQARFPGRRPVCFGTPFEAGVWAILSQRTGMRAAARVKERLTVELGTELTLGGASVRCPPGPDRMRAVAGGSGLPPVKVERLRGLADAAAAGRLDAWALRAVPVDEALASLQELPGIGAFSASLVLVRGAGHPDVLPLAEARLRDAMALAYGRPTASLDDREITRIAEGWQPYRSWVAFLLRNLLDEERRR